MRRTASSRVDSAEDLPHVFLQSPTCHREPAVSPHYCDVRHGFRATVPALDDVLLHTFEDISLYSDFGAKNGVEIVMNLSVCITGHPSKSGPVTALITLACAVKHFEK